MTILMDSVKNRFKTTQALLRAWTSLLPFTCRTSCFQVIRVLQYLVDVHVELCEEKMRVNTTQLKLDTRCKTLGMPRVAFCMLHV